MDWIELDGKSTLKTNRSKNLKDLGCVWLP